MTGSQAMNSLVPITGSTARRVDLHVERAGEPPGGRRTQLGGTRGQRVAGRVGGRDERVLDDRGHRVNRGAHGQVNRPAGEGAGLLRDRGELVPGVLGEPCGEGHSSAACGGSAATSGWSLPILPTLDAPPGEPSSSKKSTLTL